MPDRLECLPYCLCDKKKVGFCLDKVTYNEKKVLLKLFFNIQQQGSVNAYVTVEDVMGWFFRQERKMFKQWFPEIKEAENDQTWLTWEVNAHLRMQDIEQEVRSDRLARRQQGSELKNASAPSDLKSSDSAVADFLLTSDDLKVPLVKRILRDLELELRYYQCSRLCSRLEVVADIVTRLLLIMKTDSSATPYNRTSMSLTELAMDIVCAVLRNLSSGLPITSLHVHYSHLSAARMTQSVHQKLMKSLYTPDDMKHFLSTSNETLMASVTEHVSLKVIKLFQQQSQLSEPPSILRLFMTASNYRSSPSTGQKLVIHSDTVASVVTLVLLQLYSEEDTQYVFQPHNWPLVIHVVNFLSLSDMKVTKKKNKVNCYFNMHEVVCMVNSICEELLTVYDTMESLMEALSYKNRMVSRDIGRQVSGQLQIVWQNRKIDRPHFEMPPCPDLENVICGVVARFVHILVPVTMSNKEDLIICLLLVDQIRYLTEVGFFQSVEKSSIVCHLRELSADMVEQLGDMVFNQYIEFYPSHYIQDHLHTLVMDKKQSFMISNMIITTLLDYVKLLQNISHEEYKETTSGALQPPPNSFSPSASTAVKPPPGFPVPVVTTAVKPPPGFPVPVVTTAVNLPPGFPVPVVTTAVKPPPGFPVPVVTTAVKPPPGFPVPVETTLVNPPPEFASPATTTTVKPPPGFSVPAATPTVGPPPGFAAPSAKSAIKTPPGFAASEFSAGVKPPPGFTAPATTPAVKPPSGFHVPAAAPAVKPSPELTSPDGTLPVRPPPGFAAHAATPRVKPPPGFIAPDASIAVQFSVLDSAPAVKPPPELTAPDAISTVRPPPSFPVLDASTGERLPPGLTAPAPAALTPEVKSPPGFHVLAVRAPSEHRSPDAIPTVRPPPGFAAHAAVPMEKPPTGFTAPDYSTVVKPPTEFTAPDYSTVVKPPPGFASPAAKPTVMLPPGFTARDYSTVVKPPPGFTAPDYSTVVKPPPGFTAPDYSTVVKPPPGFTAPDYSTVVKPPTEFTAPDYSTVVKPPPGCTAPDYSTVVKPPPGFPNPETTSTVQPIPGFSVPSTTTLRLPPGFAEPAAKPEVKPPPGIPVPSAAPTVRSNSRLAVLHTSPVVKPPAGFTVPVGRPAVKPPPGFSVPVVSTAARPPTGFAVPYALTAARSPPGFSAPDASTAARPPVLDITPTEQPPTTFAVSAATPTAKPPTGSTVLEASTVWKPPTELVMPTVVKPPTGFPVSRAKMPPGFNAPVGTLIMALHPGFAAPDPTPSLQPPHRVLPECSRSELCPEVPGGEEETQGLTKMYHVSVEDIALKITSDGSKNDHSQTSLHSESIMSSKKRGIKGFLRKLRKSLRFWAPSSDTQRQKTELCRNH